MTPSKRLQRFIDFGNTLQGADVYYRESWDCYYCSLLGKSFGLLTNERLTLKGDLKQNILLREQYEDVEPGYYSNKKHWNSIPTLTESFTDEEIEDMILKSYELVYDNLLKRDKLIVDEMPSH